MRQKEIINLCFLEKISHSQPPKSNKHKYIFFKILSSPLNSLLNILVKNVFQETDLCKSSYNLGPLNFRSSDTEFIDCGRNKNVNKVFSFSHHGIKNILT